MKGITWNRPENLVCNGPYKINNWSQNKEIHLTKNPFYRDTKINNIENVSLHFIEPNLEHYLTDKIDWCRVENQANLPVHHPNETFLMQYLETYFLGFSCHKFPFKNKLLREAFAKSINKDELVQKVWSNVQKPATGGAVPPGISGHSPEISPSFDPIGAGYLFNQARYKSNLDLPSLTLGALSGFGDLPHYLQTSWEKYLGIKVQIIENISFDEMIKMINQGLVQLTLGGWSVDYPDPDNILRALFHGNSPANYFGWQNKTFDKLVEQAAILTDQQARLKLYHQADKVLVAEETAIVPLYYRQAYGLLRSGFELAGESKIIRGGMFKLKNIRFNPIPT
jgi:oligopeptide transport system substrate-binding protein